MKSPSQRKAVKAPTIKDLAKHVGVHISTVSRSLNPETRNLIGSDMVKKVLAAADELGYVPNSMASALRKGQSRTIGIVIPDLMNPIFPPFIRGIQDTLEEAGYTAFIANSDGNKDSEQLIVQKMKARIVDGLIMASAVFKNDPAIRECTKKDIPVVLINRDIEDENISAVVNDDRHGIFEAVKHLAELGHTRIAHVAGPQTTYTGLVRYRAFVEAMQTGDLIFDEYLINFAHGYSVQAGEKAFSQILDQKMDFSAVIAANDQLALGVLDSLAKAGKRCPKDLSLVGFNDMPLVDRINPPLTTLRIQHYEMGAQAARILLEELDNPKLPTRTMMLKPKLMVRKSTTKNKDH
ncbi:MAG: LacI family transcriptional regulator [Rhodospirillales bacterium]|nr:LacI family transcriptional regulator [Rhodospirillales bacterium]